VTVWLLVLVIFLLYFTRFPCSVKTLLIDTRKQWRRFSMFPSVVFMYFLLLKWQEISQ